MTATEAQKRASKKRYEKLMALKRESQLKGGQEEPMGLFKPKQAAETFTEATEDNIDDSIVDDVYEDAIEEPEPVEQQVKKVIRTPQPQPAKTNTRTIQRPSQQRPIQQPQPTLIEREITLSLLNDKLNFIIAKLQEAD